MKSITCCTHLVCNNRNLTAASVSLVDSTGDGSLRSLSEMATSKTSELISLVLTASRRMVDSVTSSKYCGYLQNKGRPTGRPGPAVCRFQPMCRPGSYAGAVIIHLRTALWERLGPRDKNPLHRIALPHLPLPGSQHTAV